MASQNVGSEQYRVILESVTLAFGEGAKKVTALRNVTIGFAPGRFVAVMGPQGAGKTALLCCVAGLVRPVSGEVRLCGMDLAGLTDDEVADLRERHAEVLLEKRELMPLLTVRENLVAAGGLDEDWLTVLAASAGLGNCLDKRPGELSDGERGRVGMARALAARADLVVAEPPGLPPGEDQAGLGGSLRRAAETGTTVLAATDDPVLASHADMVIFLRDGRLVDAVAGASEKVISKCISLL